MFIRTLFFLDGDEENLKQAYNLFQNINSHTSAQCQNWWQAKQIKELLVNSFNEITPYHMHAVFLLYDIAGAKQ